MILHQYDVAHHGTRRLTADLYPLSGHCHINEIHQGKALDLGDLADHLLSGFFPR